MAVKWDTVDRHEAGRLVAFSDGVVAIAITLLILPLAGLELPKPGEPGSGNPLAFIWSENSSLITSFLITWAVIMVFWFVHHRLFGQIAYVNGEILKWNIIWLFGIVILPFPGNLLQQAHFGEATSTSNRQIVGFYVASMLLISLCLSMISMQMRKHPDLLSEEARARPRQPLIVSWSFTTYLTALLVVSLIWPVAGLYGLFGLALIRPVTLAILNMPKPGPEVPPTDDSTTGSEGSSTPESSS